MGLVKKDINFISYFMRKFCIINKAVVQGTKRMISTKKTSECKAPARPLYKSIVEGRAVLRLTSNGVFYNPVQEFNRDLSIAVLSVFTEDYKKYMLALSEIRNNRNGEVDVNPVKIDNEPSDHVDITILEALSATGLRSIRYAQEVVNATKVIANDISEYAVKTIKENVDFNNVDHIVETSLEDACILMYKHRDRPKRFAAIDLDPYGCPAIYLDSAVQSVADGGMLLVTATDMAVMAGNSPETCYSKYGAISLKTKCCHEMAIRILLQCIEAHANRHSRYIVPVLSVSADFYIRVFVKVYSGADQCKNTLTKVSMVYHCVGCDTIILHPLGEIRPNPKGKIPGMLKTCIPQMRPIDRVCDNCNSKIQMGGPIWSAPIHDRAFVSRVIDLVLDAPSQFGTARRLEGVLSVICEELQHAPLYYTVDRLCGTIHCEMIPILLIRSAIMNCGYEVSFSHANKLSVKTNAPPKVVWDILRTWANLHPIKAAKLAAHPVAKHILSQPVTCEVILQERDDANPDSRRQRQARFQFNPTPHWGPGCKSALNDGEYKLLKTLSTLEKNKIKNKIKKSKRRLSPPDDDDSKKRTSDQKLVINTTLDIDSDNSAELKAENAEDVSVSGKPNANVDTELDARIGTVKLDADIGTEDSGLVASTTPN